MTDSTIDRFAEALSQHDAFAKPPDKGGKVPECARRVGVQPEYGRVLLGRIRRGLGWQAV